MLLTGVLLSIPACDRGADAPKTLPIEQASDQVKSSFAGARPEVRQAADDAAKSMQQGNYVDSFNRLEELSVESDLTPEQRQKLGESRAAVMLKVTDAAAGGDANAAKALEMHRARK